MLQLAIDLFTLKKLLLVILTNQIRIAYVLNEKELISATNILKEALIQYSN